MSDTLNKYDEIINSCRTLFVSKMTDYGCAWRILRPSSLTDQIFIKAHRIRSIQCKGTQKVEDNIQDEFIGIINYCLMALIQLEKGYTDDVDANKDEILSLYDKYSVNTKALLENKNHDYDEAWRDMRVSSIVDIILMKLLRVKQIEDKQGKTLVSEGIDANYYDIILYSVFALILYDVM
ncbi:DUF1599 domain-containing protein [Bacteroidales bacterium OttesenSCG-928-K22]|nr:DUF1599 domain-containing protein [Bacteroidales bacterium OttesenSCG-928-L14]MDL2241226.1 DUF1599 domain-containing protein [Bacteroidales bacterium OttesenSCG-928-K22]